MTYDLRVLSLGAGTQSSALLMLAIRGELPEKYLPLDAAIFADTGDEPAAVYEYLDTLKAEAASAGVPLYTVHGAGGQSLADYATDETKTSDTLGIPAHLRHADGSHGIARRHCTRAFKIRPIRRKVRELVGGSTSGVKVAQLIGMSLDEVKRMKPSGAGYVDNVYPLIEMGWRRQKAIDYLREIGMPEPPRSACVYCPYRSDAEWRSLRDSDPAGWKFAVEVDERLRQANRTINAESKRTGRRLGAYDGDMFLHRSLLPLAAVDLSTEEDHGQGVLWDMECEGMCGA